MFDRVQPQRLLDAVGPCCAHTLASAPRSCYALNCSRHTRSCAAYYRVPRLPCCSERCTVRAVLCSTSGYSCRVLALTTARGGVKSSLQPVADEENGLSIRVVRHAEGAEGKT